MQQVKTPYELDDITLLNLLCPPDPTQVTEKPAEHLSAEEAEEIFRQAEAEIQPMLESYRRWKRKDLLYALAEFLCFCIFLFSLGGIVWQCITYPHTLVILYTKAHPATITTTLDLQTRTLAPVTITRSATTATTGTGHQDAIRAMGTLTFYNGLFTSPFIAQGTVFTGRDGVKVTTDQSVTIPPNAPPVDGQATVFAHAQSPGAAGNIAASDIAITLNNELLVRNSFFSGGEDARTFRAVAANDLTTLTATVNGTVTQAFTNAFPLQKGEEAQPTNCTTKATPNHQAGEQAQSVTIIMSKTCSAVAYRQRELTRAATVAFTKTHPGASYHLVGSLQIILQSVSPFTVILSGKWAFTFSQGYQDSLAEQIQGDTPEKARAFLLRTGVISYASVPNTLASADYINFYVLVG